MSEARTPARSGKKKGSNQKSTRTRGAGGVSKKNPDLTFVIPVYNEEGSLETLTDQIYGVVRELKFDFEILFVDDGSTDESRGILDRLARERSEIQIIRFRRNSGKSAALAMGFQRARGEVVFTMDADLQDDPEEIPHFLEALDGGADMVTGWKLNRQDPMEKRIPSRLFNAITSYMSGIHLHDFNCGFKAYRKDVVREIPMYGEMHHFIPFLAHRQGFRVVEIPVKHHPRKFGKSKFGMERYLRGFFDLMTVSFLTTFLYRPMHFFGKTALSIMGAGGAIFLYLIFGRWIQGISIGTSPLLAVSFLMITIGVQVGIFGLLAELVVHDRRKKVPYSILSGDGDS